MEWTGRQQMFFLLQSIGLGAVQGFALDVITGLTRPFVKKTWLWTDVLFGPVAAVCTFFGALAVMDGHLHPLLLFGVIVGMAAEHILIGVWVCRFLRRVRRMMRNAVRIGDGYLRCMAGACARRWQDLRLRKVKRRKKAKNDGICPTFFKKRLEISTDTK